MHFPSRLDINAHVRMLDRVVRDPILKAGTVQTRRGSSEPLSFNGGFAIVYKVVSSGRPYALKCWAQDIGDAAHRYEAVTRHLNGNKAAYLMDFAFLKDGISISGAAYPILRMGWVEGKPLQEFVEDAVQRGDKQSLADLATAFRQMCQSMASGRIAHGDMQGPNLLVRNGNSGKPEIVLIDYDAMVVPALIGSPVTTGGNPNYQHPSRQTATVAAEHDDHFSQLVIYVSLLALSQDLSLWQRYYKGDEALLFRAEDFVISPTAIFTDLRSAIGTVNRLAVALWNYSRCSGVASLPALEVIIRAAETPPPLTSGAPAPNSAFETLLKSKMNGNTAATPSGSGGWFDEAVFVQTSRSQPPSLPTGSNRTNPPRLPNASSPPTSSGFNQILVKRGGKQVKRSVANGPLQGATSPNPGKRTIAAVIVCALMAFIMLVICANARNSEQSTILTVGIIAIGIAWKLIRG